MSRHARAAAALLVLGAAVLAAAGAGMAGPATAGAAAAGAGSAGVGAGSAGVGSGSAGVGAGSAGVGSGSAGVGAGSAAVGAGFATAATRTATAGAAARGASRRGTTTLVLKGRALRALRAQGVSISVRRPARLKRSTISLPVAGGSIERVAALRLRGGLVLRARVRGRSGAHAQAHRRVRTVRVTRIQLRMGAVSRISAKVGKRRVALFRVRTGKRLKLDAGKGAVRLARGAIMLTRPGAVAIRRALGLRHLRAGRFGAIRVRATVTPRATVPGAPGSPKPPSGPGAPAPGGPPGGGPGGTPPVSGPIATEPPVLARPATAVDVSGVDITWYPRDSWIRYVATGQGTTTSGGASATASTSSACPNVPSSSDALLPYAIHFTAKRSWYDAASATAGIYGQGTAAFRYPAHGIDLSASDPEIEIAGAASRAIFHVKGSGGTAYPDTRAALFALDLSGQPTVGNGGRTLTYTRLPERLTADGQQVFAGFYPPPDDGFGCVSVTFTTP